MKSNSSHFVIFANIIVVHFINIIHKGNFKGVSTFTFSLTTGDKVSPVIFDISIF